MARQQGWIPPLLQRSGPTSRPQTHAWRWSRKRAKAAQRGHTRRDRGKPSHFKEMGSASRQGLGSGRFRGRKQLQRLESHVSFDSVVSRGTWSAVASLETARKQAHLLAGERASHALHGVLPAKPPPRFIVRSSSRYIAPYGIELSRRRSAHTPPITENANERSDGGGREGCADRDARPGVAYCNQVTTRRYNRRFRTAHSRRHQTEPTKSCQRARRAFGARLMREKPSMEHARTAVKLQSYVRVSQQQANKSWCSCSLSVPL